MTAAEPIMVVERPAEEGKADFPALVRRLSGYAYTMALRSLGNRDDAEDAVQEAFLKLHRAMENDVPIENPGAYLAGIQRNVCHDLLDRRRRFPAPAGDLPDSARPVGSHDVPLADRIPDVLEAIGGLPEPQGEIVLMKHLEGRTLAEIASILGRTEDSVRGLLYRGMETLRSRFGVGG